MSQPQRSVGRSYTAGRRQPYLIRKWPGSRWTLPLGPYTLTQLAVLVGSIVLLVKTRAVWAHLGPLNTVIGIGVPVALTFAARRTRIEGRDPVRALLAGVVYLLQPRGGYLRGQAHRLPGPVVQAGRAFPVTTLPQTQTQTATATAAQTEPRRGAAPVPVFRAGPQPGPARTVGLAELLAAAAENRTR